MVDEKKVAEYLKDDSSKCDICGRTHPNKTTAKKAYDKLKKSNKKLDWDSFLYGYCIGAVHYGRHILRKR